MSDQSQTASNTEPIMCKNGCGFFGNGATGGCCSKCWRDTQKKEEPTTTVPVEDVQPMEVVEEKTEPMEIEQAPQPEPVAEPTPVLTQTPKKKKKKASYRNMMKTMMKSDSPSRDVEKQKQSISKVTGGGAFTKIDKI